MTSSQSPTSRTLAIPRHISITPVCYTSHQRVSSLPIFNLAQRSADMCPSYVSFLCHPYTSSNKGAQSSGRGAETLKASHSLLVMLLRGLPWIRILCFVHLEPDVRSCVIRCIFTLVQSENGNIFQCYVFCFVWAMSRWTFCDVTKDLTIPCHLRPGVLHDLRDHQAAALFKKPPTKSLV